MAINISCNMRRRTNVTLVCFQLLELAQWKSSKKISIFLSLSEEINTEEILQSALQSNKECFIPRYIGPNMDMLRLYSWQDYEELPKTRWNIKQPPDDDTSRESALDSGRCNFSCRIVSLLTYCLLSVVHITYIWPINKEHCLQIV